jgi:hypothetical protein
MSEKPLPLLINIEAKERTLEELIEALDKHFVGLWVYQPYGKDRMWCATFRDTKGEYWETDLHDKPENALGQALAVVWLQRAGHEVKATGQHQEVS